MAKLGVEEVLPRGLECLLGKGIIDHHELSISRPEDGAAMKECTGSGFRGMRNMVSAERRSIFCRSELLNAKLGAVGVREIEGNISI